MSAPWLDVRDDERTLADLPTDADVALARSYIETYGSARVLRVRTHERERLASEAQRYMVCYRAQHGVLPACDVVWVLS